MYKPLRHYEKIMKRKNCRLDTAMLAFIQYQEHIAAKPQVLSSQSAPAMDLQMSLQPSFSLTRERLFLAWTMNSES